MLLHPALSEGVIEAVGRLEEEDGAHPEVAAMAERGARRDARPGVSRALPGDRRARRRGLARDAGRIARRIRDRA